MILVYKVMNYIDFILTVVFYIFLRTRISCAALPVDIGL